jgi:hypothetical protein
MKTLRMLAAALPAAVFTGAARAHEGHGLPGAAHWHATDTFGLVLVVALGAAAVAWSRRK